MDILFDRHYPKNLVEAIKLIQQLDSSALCKVSFYDSAVNDQELVNPILFRVDKHRKGVEPVTEILFENGFRVIALKFPKDKYYDFFDLSLIILNIWPKIITLLKEKNKPFIYKCNGDHGKLILVKE
ncbi:hypothetical protein CA265_14085 [Sphingobacteriaceae bacterium GW460-11-11-14-LB5]|nr:hypothetical protein CA265_14085 [Sphingobacteriaceae bacterium GW460-11-11-14-LB5]